MLLLAAQGHPVQAHSILDQLRGADSPQKRTVPPPTRHNRGDRTTVLLQNCISIPAGNLSKGIGVGCVRWVTQGVVSLSVLSGKRRWLHCLGLLLRVGPLRSQCP